jgi:hypothetical protein
MHCVAMSGSCIHLDLISPRRGPRKRPIPLVVSSSLSNNFLAAVQDSDKRLSRGSVVVKIGLDFNPLTYNFALGSQSVREAAAGPEQQQDCHDHELTSQ